MLKRGLAGLLLITVLWGGGVLLFDVPEYLLPGPLTVLSRLAFLNANAGLMGHVQVTLIEIFWGFLVGLLAGVMTAVVFVRLPITERLATPLILLLQTAPKIAIAPLLLLWLGLGPAPKIVLIAIVTFFPVMTGMVSGLRFVNKSYLDLAQVLKLSPWQRFVHIELPAALPTVFAGATVATTLAMTAAVIGELMGANKGLGYLLSAGQENADTASVIGIVLVLSLMGWLFYEVFEALRRRMESRFSDV
ncbi:ABC transporter permease [Pseudooceanicola spongiae]|jgi:NitT/TauT family transport system permease protein|uniref:ABC transporter permease subunit n=1 Tax=Pseudooceanicola spongiae TaxID=2613965 RepID=A0A7L9WHZ2_9RHOB|nr:ABC transporter permease [Pseudooceanicola spongiae]QOL79562.1 ABC transporter permease subunit [Pseudooceanicola spongiae]